MDSLQMVATHSEQVLDYSVDNQEPLDLTCRSEPSHLSLLLAGRLMGSLGSVVLVLTSSVDH